MTKAGVIGLGVIGSGVALCLARAGLLGAVYDVRHEASNGLDGVPAVASSPADVARHCDVVLIAVVDAKQTIDVLCAVRRAYCRKRASGSTLFCSRPFR